MEIPSKVRQAAQYLVEMYGDHVEHLRNIPGQRLLLPLS